MSKIQQLTWKNLENDKLKPKIIILILKKSWLKKSSSMKNCIKFSILPMKIIMKIMS